MGLLLGFFDFSAFFIEVCAGFLQEIFTGFLHAGRFLTLPLRRMSAL